MESVRLLRVRALTSASCEQLLDSTAEVLHQLDAFELARIESGNAPLRAAQLAWLSRIVSLLEAPPSPQLHWMAAKFAAQVGCSGLGALKACGLRLLRVLVASLSPSLSSLQDRVHLALLEAATAIWVHSADCVELMKSMAPLGSALLRSVLHACASVTLRPHTLPFLSALLHASAFPRAVQREADTFLMTQLCCCEASDEQESLAAAFASLHTLKATCARVELFLSRCLTTLNCTLQNLERVPLRTHPKQCLHTVGAAFSVHRHALSFRGVARTLEAVLKRRGSRMIALPLQKIVAVLVRALRLDPTPSPHSTADFHCTAVWITQQTALHLFTAMTELFGLQLLPFFAVVGSEVSSLARASDGIASLGILPLRSALHATTTTLLLETAAVAVTLQPAIESALRDFTTPLTERQRDSAPCTAATMALRTVLRTATPLLPPTLLNRLARSVWQRVACGGWEMKAAGMALVGELCVNGTGNLAAVSLRLLQAAVQDENACVRSAAVRAIAHVERVLHPRAPALQSRALPLPDHARGNELPAATEPKPFQLGGVLPKEVPNAVEMPVGREEKKEASNAMEPAEEKEEEEVSLSQPLPAPSPPPPLRRLQTMILPSHSHTEPDPATDRLESDTPSTGQGPSTEGAPEAGVEEDTVQGCDVSSAAGKRQDSVSDSQDEEESALDKAMDATAVAPTTASDQFPSLDLTAPPDVTARMWHF